MANDKNCTVCDRVYRSEQDFLSGTSRWRICTEGNLWFNCSCGSTLMLIKGKFDWYSPDRFMGPEARGVFHRLAALKALPHLPASAMQLQQAMQNPNLSPQHAARLLRQEPVIAAHVLKIAENLRCARNPLNQPIRSLEHAIVYIGFKAIGDLLTTSALRTLSIPPSDFNAEAFWNESYVRGAVAEAIIKLLGLELNQDEAYLAGSLCDIGKLAIALCFPPLASKIHQTVNNTRALSTWRLAEISVSAPDHSILGEITATLWGLPDFVTDAARRHHHAPASTSAEPLTLWELVAAATQLTHWALLQPHRIEHQVIDAFRARVGMSERDLEAFALELTTLSKVVLQRNLAA